MNNRRGFTLIEAIVVTVMVAALAVVLVTRLTGASTRTFDLASEQLGDLVLMYAIRSEFAEEPIGIMVDTERNSVLLMIRRGDRDDGNGGWVRDPSVREVVLPNTIPVTDMEFRADGDWVDPTERPLSSLPGQPRPHIDIMMVSNDPRLERSRRLILMPTAWRPLVRDSILSEDAAPSRRQVDLDMTGRWQEDW
ncbi:MAG: type II secretion system GspH family protein [Phycisphaerales bacterium]|nr:type II secretion system GspH family protein [Phycisphaerales bacterium]